MSHDPVFDSHADDHSMDAGTEDTSQNQSNYQEQRFLVNPDGSVDIGWVQPEFSDVILEIVLKEKSINDELNKGKPPRIFCG